MNRRDTSVAPTPYGWLLCAVVAGLLAATAAVGADALAREGWSHVDRSEHFIASLGLYFAVASAAAATLWAMAWGGQRLERWALPRSRGSAWLLAPLLMAALGTFLFRDTAVWTFSGTGVQDSALARWGPQLFLGATAIGFFALAAAVRDGLRRAAAGHAAVPLTLASALAAAGAGLCAIDLNVFVALYQRLHVMLEVVAGLLLMSAAALLIALLYARSNTMRRSVRFLGAAGLCWLASFVVVSPLRSGLDESLNHALSQPAYVGRMLLRVQLAEAYLRDPGAWEGASASRMDRFQRRFDIGSVALSPEWNEPRPEPEALNEKLMELRRGAQDFNVVVFYVDALRFDTASDPATMPNAVALAQRSLEFKRAYSYASDTVTSLPVLMSGRYDDQHKDRQDLLSLARKHNLPTALFIAKSARRFLANQLPDFSFEDTVDVVDYGPNKKVWGYGADRSSALDVVDETLRWIDDRTSERFFTWLFHFDVHNWRELDSRYIDHAASNAGIQEEDARRRRYRAAAAGVDVALGRFLDGLKERKLDDKTIVVLVADHGEALGRRGHWVHAVFLWESLVHTPLIMHVPGVAPQRIDAPVGHVDVMPTLARYLDPNADVSKYHGVDLLAHVADPEQAAGLPLLMMSMRKQDVLRIGLIDRRPPYHKLVLPLESVEPELHDLNVNEPDDVNVAPQRRAVMLRLLSSLVRSPVFPRPDEDDKGEKPTALRR